MKPGEFAAMMPNAKDKFLAAVQEQFGKTLQEAEHIYELFYREKVVILDNGNFRLSWGGFWEMDVMDNALGMEL